MEKPMAQAPDPSTVPAAIHSPPPSGRGGSKRRLPGVLSHPGADIAASLVVFLVALPLSLGIAAASGAPIMAGLIAAAVGGIVAGSLGGSPLQVSGPAAGLTVVVAGLVQEFGWQVTCAITAAAGVVQLLLGISRVGRAALAVSPALFYDIATARVLLVEPAGIQFLDPAQAPRRPAHAGPPAG